MPFWSWTGTATQSNAAGGIVRIDITAGVGNVVHVLYARTVGAFGAADNLDLLLVDEDNTTVIALGGIGAATAPIMTLPRAFTNVDSTTNTAFASSLGGIKLVGPDLKLTAETSAVAQNDTVQVLLLAKVKRGPGTVSVTRSTGTVAAISPTVNEVY